MPLAQRAHREKGRCLGNAARKSGSWKVYNVSVKVAWHLKLLLWPGTCSRNGDRLQLRLFFDDKTTYNPRLLRLCWLIAATSGLISMPSGSTVSVFRHDGGRSFVSGRASIGFARLLPAPAPCPLSVASLALSLGQPVCRCLLPGCGVQTGDVQKRYGRSLLRAPGMVAALARTSSRPQLGYMG